MLKTFWKHIFLLFGYRLIFVLLFPLSASLAAQSDQDTVSVVQELSLDDSEETDKTDEESSETLYNSFIKKDELNTGWQPAGQRNIPDTVVTTLKNDDAFWYADVAVEKRKKPDSKNRNTPLGLQPWFRTLIWIIIIGGFAAFLIIYLNGSNVGLFRKRNVLIAESDDEAMPEDIFAINYQKEIEKAASAGNYRLSVRLMFLRLLKNMSERNIINYKQDKTNFDYLSELYNTEWYKQFFKVTRNYEYSWYGQFEISGDAYELIRKDFDQFENKLS